MRYLNSDAAAALGFAAILVAVIVLYGLFG